MVMMVMTIMGLLERILQWFGGGKPDEVETIYGNGLAGYTLGEDEPGGTVTSIWDVLRFKENTQAFHLKDVVGFDEWVGMVEVKRRIQEVFGVVYKNDRSLYPYIKTLVDAGLFETVRSDGKQKWRRKELLVKLKKKKQSEAEKALATN